MAIIIDVHVARIHSWDFDYAQAAALQKSLAKQVSTSGDFQSPRFIAGADISARRARGMATAAVVVLTYPGLEIAEVKTVQAELEVPYIPGMLSFREAPLILSVLESLTVTPDLILVDGQGIAHPRRLGIASHLGLFLDKPTIGCAKSLLCGEYDEPPADAGTYSEIRDSGETIGAALRTRPGTKPVYVSIGHRIDLATAIHWVLNCCRGYRLPEPTRLAHMAAGGNLQAQKVPAK